MFEVFSSFDFCALSFNVLCALMDFSPHCGLVVVFVSLTTSHWCSPCCRRCCCSPGGRPFFFVIVVVVVLNWARNHRGCCVLLPSTKKRHQPRLVRHRVVDSSGGRGWYPFAFSLFLSVPRLKRRTERCSSLA